MGGKHVRTWKHVLFCIAGIAFLLVSGCATFRELNTRHNAQKSLLYSKELLARGNYKESLEENRKVLSLFVKGSPGDEALFNMGLIYAHHDNPDRNYQKSLIYFNSIIKRYPHSPFITEANIWVNILESIEKRKTIKVKIAEIETEPEKETKKEISQENIKVKNQNHKKIEEHLTESQKLLSQGNFTDALKENQKVLDMPPARPFKDQALFNTALIYAHNSNPEKDYNKSIEYFRRLIEEFPESPLVEQTKIWLDVLNVIEKAKQVDIDIEKTKKEMKK